MNGYAEFLATKRKAVTSVGPAVEPGDLHPSLHPWQADITAWTVRVGRAGMWTTTGTGKTRMSLEWARLSGRTSLILAPLAVCQQTIREAARHLDLEVRYVRDGEHITGPGVWISNYEMADRFDPRDLDAVVLDEGCFPAGTLIDTPDGPVPIESISIGDPILNAAGVDTVSSATRTEVPYAVRVSVASHQITSSPDHPFFTQRGWVGAQDLEPGDSLLETAEALRMVRAALHAENEAGGRAQAVLRAVLLSEMADDSAGDQGEGAQPRGGSETRRAPSRISGVRFGEGPSGDRAHPRAEPVHVGGRAGEDLSHAARSSASSFRAWGQWSWLDRAAAETAGCSWIELGGGVCCVAGPADSWVSHELQARLGASRAASRYRAGWQLTPWQAPRSGRQERREAGFTRVDGVEVLEPGDPRLDGLRDADGKLRFYDLGGTRHRSYSITGHLVHNSILRDSTGATRNLLVEHFAPVPRRMSCTATPRPNDAEELTNQAAFLGVMSRVDMLSSYFIHDDAGWRVKAHAREPMYRWMSSFAVALRRPSDLGAHYSDDGYDLPGLQVIPQIIPVELDVPGQLFATDLGGVSGTARVRRETLTARCGRAAELVAAEPDEPWLLWCGLNDEADELARLVPGAVNVHGSMSPEEKAEALLGFADGAFPVLITKPSIAARGLNYQRCARMAFVGLSHSYEDYFQAIRRCHRYGQTRVVHAHVVLSELEAQIAANVARKEREADEFMAELVDAMRRARTMQEVAA